MVDDQAECFIMQTHILVNGSAVNCLVTGTFFLSGMNLAYLLACNVMEHFASLYYHGAQLMYGTKTNVRTVSICMRVNASGTGMLQENLAS